MSTKDLLRRAQDMLSIEDVYIRSAEARSHPDFDPMLPDAGKNLSYNVQIRCGAKSDIGLITSQTDIGTQLRVLYAIDTGLRLLKPAVAPDNQEPSADDLIADISAIFLVRYLVRGDTHPGPDLLAAFADNAIHHMWPYWREFLQATSARLRLPPIVLPVRVVRPKPAPESSQPAKT